MFSSSSDDLPVRRLRSKETRYLDGRRALHVLGNF